MNLVRLIEEKSSLAAIYAHDGALHTAALILRETADIVSQRAQEADAFIAALQAKDDCPGHVASVGDPKTCRRCGIHIDELRPEDGDPVNLAGSGPVPIEPREEERS